MQEYQELKAEIKSLSLEIRSSNLDELFADKVISKHGLGKVHGIGH